jgi:hypothetical protein
LISHVGCAEHGGTFGVCSRVDAFSTTNYPRIHLRDQLQCTEAELGYEIDGNGTMSLLPHMYSNVIECDKDGGGTQKVTTLFEFCAGFIKGAFERNDPEAMCCQKLRLEIVKKLYMCSKRWMDCQVSSQVSPSLPVFDAREEAACGSGVPLG